MFCRASQSSEQLLTCYHEPLGNKENTNLGDNAGCRRQTLAGSSVAPNFMLMNKRQLINTLHSILLVDIKSVLVERTHEFTDCAYTKHEHRESILVLMYCIKMQLARLVKLIYRLVSSRACLFLAAPLKTI